VKELDTLYNRNGAIETKETLALCRCGGSKNKPFCDGSHWHNHFTDDKN
jgi:CDGSH-type Zn-finger protein